MVFVDHTPGFPRAPPPGDSKVVLPAAPPMTSSIPVGGMGIESDPNFSKLSACDRELHLWAMVQTRNQIVLQSNVQLLPDCIAEADALAKEHPLGDKPLVDVSSDQFRSSDYVKFQKELLSLSQNSKEIIAKKSGHFVIIDRPDVVIDAIRQVVLSVRNNAKL